MGNKATERILSGANEAVRNLNPHVFGAQKQEHTTVHRNECGAEVSAVRVRQDTKPLMNKLESDWLENLKRQPEVNQKTLRPQAKRYKLANGAWYKPDITGHVNGRETAWECKGPKQMKGVARGILTMKVAASQWPEVEFRLVWRQQGRWHQQIVLP